MRRALALGSVLSAIVACGGSAIIVGDDTSPTSSPVDPLIDPDAALIDGGGDEEGEPIKVPPQDSGDGDAPGDVTCPVLSPPAPSFCDGATPVPKYDKNACIVGYGCAPLDCASAGGTCVGLAPGTCPGNKYGDATKYSCGGGLGVACCLP